MMKIPILFSVACLSQLVDATIVRVKPNDAPSTERSQPNILDDGMTLEWASASYSWTSVFRPDPSSVVRIPAAVGSSIPGSASTSEPSCRTPLIHPGPPPLFTIDPDGGITTIPRPFPIPSDLTLPPHHPKTVDVSVTAGLNPRQWLRPCLDRGERGEPCGRRSRPIYANTSSPLTSQSTTVADGLVVPSYEASASESFSSSSSSGFMSVSSSTSVSHPFTSSSPPSATPCSRYGDGQYVLSVSLVYTATITITDRRDLPDFTEAPPPPACPPTGSSFSSGHHYTHVKHPGIISLIDVETTTSTFVFVTTAMHPAVVLATPPATPLYSLGATGGPDDVQPSSSSAQPAIQTHVIMNDPIGGVTIDGAKFADIPSASTMTATVGGALFTIAPLAVTGPGNVVIPRPILSTIGFRPIETQASIAGIPIEIHSTLVTLGQSTFSIDATAHTVVVSSQTVEIAPSGVSLAGVSITFPPVIHQPRQQVVAGGGLITAIGPSIVVIRSSTITYGAEYPVLTRSIDGDVVVVGPSGVSLHDFVIGGPSASASATTLELVGGVTVSELNPTEAAIGSSTFTFSPPDIASSGLALTPTTTTVFTHGQTIIVGPTALTISSLTLSYPLGPTVVSTIIATASPTTAAPPPPSLMPATGVLQTEFVPTSNFLATSSPLGADIVATIIEGNSPTTATELPPRPSAPTTTILFTGGHTTIIDPVALTSSSLTLPYPLSPTVVSATVGTDFPTTATPSPPRTIEPDARASNSILPGVPVTTKKNASVSRVPDRFLNALCFIAMALWMV